MQIININDVNILVAEIQNEFQNRRSNERLTIAELLGEAIPGASLGHHLNGAPYIHERPELFVSVSHSQALAALAISSKSEIGIDIEAPRQQLNHVASRFLSTAEIALFATLSDGLLRAWTAKEAIYKCAGYSGVNFASEIQITPDGKATLRDKTFTLHWHNINSHILCLATPN